MYIFLSMHLVLEEVTVMMTTMYLESIGVASLAEELPIYTVITSGYPHPLSFWARSPFLYLRFLILFIIIGSISDIHRIITLYLHFWFLFVISNLADRTLASGGRYVTRIIFSNDHFIIRLNSRYIIQIQLQICRIYLFTNVTNTSLILLIGLFFGFIIR